MAEYGKNTELKEGGSVDFPDFSITLKKKGFFHLGYDDSNRLLVEFEVKGEREVEKAQWIEGFLENRFTIDGKKFFIELRESRFREKTIPKDHIVVWRAFVYLQLIESRKPV